MSNAWSFYGVFISLVFLVFESIAIGAMLWLALLIIRMACMDHGIKEPIKYGVVVNALDILRFSFGWVNGLDSLRKLKTDCKVCSLVLFAGSRNGANVYRTERIVDRLLD